MDSRRIIHTVAHCFNFTIHFSPIRAFFSCTKQEYHRSYMLDNSSLPHASVVLAT